MLRINTVRARLVPAATIKFFEVLVRVLNKSGFYLSVGCIFSFFVSRQFRKLKCSFEKEKIVQSKNCKNKLALNFNFT